MPWLCRKILTSVYFGLDSRLETCNLKNNDFIPPLIFSLGNFRCGNSDKHLCFFKHALQRNVVYIFMQWGFSGFFLLCLVIESSFPLTETGINLCTAQLERLGWLEWQGAICTGSMKGEPCCRWAQCCSAPAAFSLPFTGQYHTCLNFTNQQYLYSHIQSILILLKSLVISITQFTKRLHRFPHVKHF